MTEKPTLMELAEFLHCAAGHGYFDSVEQVALWLIDQSGEARLMLEQLKQMARDAGLEESGAWLHQAAYSHDEFERLLQATGWQDAAEVLDPGGAGGFRYEYLLSICQARLARGERPRRRLEEIRRRLERSVERDQMS